MQYNHCDIERQSRGVVLRQQESLPPETLRSLTICDHSESEHLKT